jgi:isoleucyl-tRNA synthetase
VNVRRVSAKCPLDADMMQMARRWRLKDENLAAIMPSSRTSDTGTNHQPVGGSSGASGRRGGRGERRGRDVFRPVKSQVSFIDLEREMLETWRREGTFEALRRKNAGGPTWSFLDGPITANNPMGVHHAWGRTYKDCFQRYHAMKGCELRYQNGFDCQGLWVEVEVEKELGFKTKRDIETYGIERFVEKCKERARRFAAVQTAQSVRLGYWMDWDDSYYTMSDENNYSIWHFLKKCHERGLIYQGKDSMPWCPRCGTGISQHEMHEGYREVTDDSLFVRLPLRGRDREWLLVWTTTPWTLAANVACAVNPALVYVKARQGEDTYYLAKARTCELASRGPYEIVAEMKGAALDGWAYDGPFDELAAAQGAKAAHRVVLWDEVSETEGTGIVHIAPGCGREDYELSRPLGLPVMAPIDEFGVYLDGYGAFTGRKASEVAESVMADLRSKGYYYRKAPYTHSYPHCWRCGTALLFRNVDEWYISMVWREEIEASAREARWIPSWGLERELDWLANMGDWMISKKRYWGLALPIFRCSCGWFDVVGGREELRERAVEGWEAFDGHSPHRPWVDAVKIACARCGAKVPRIPDVGNPWLDAGIVPFSTMKYRQDREYWAKWFPADLVTECFPGQFRNWFYALLTMSTMLEGRAPFKTLLGHALVRDEEGREMHKSLGNAISFDEAADRMGADVMRWVFCRQNPVANLNFGWTVGDQTRRKVFSTLWNCYSFFTSYARVDGFDVKEPQVPVAERPDIDRWLLSDLQLLVREANRRFEEYDLAAFIRRAEKFIDDLSNWYVRRNRRRFWREASRDRRDKLAAYQTLHEALVTLARLLAPVVPFITDAMYRNLVAEQDGEAPPSVHLTSYPQPKEDLIDERLSADMDVVTSAVSAALGIREARKLRVRQPLRELIVVTSDSAKAGALLRFRSQVIEELNVKSLSVREELGDLVAIEIAPRMDLLGPKYKGSAGEDRRGAQDDGRARGRGIHRRRPGSARRGGRRRVPHRARRGGGPALDAGQSCGGGHPGHHAHPRHGGDAGAQGGGPRARHRQAHPESEEGPRPGDGRADPAAVRDVR